jgi:3-isopropylmalate/(R)-2-methylmalate dehydratase large subunit
MKFVLHGKLNRWVSGKDLILYIIGKIGVDGAVYRAMEFTGDAVRNLGMADRFTMANMVIEAGAKNGIFIPDEITVSYVKDRAEREFTLYDSDPDAAYHSVIDIDVSAIEPQVAFPPLPSNTRTSDRSVTSDRPGGDRILHERPDRIPEGGRRHSQRPKGGPFVRLIVIPATPDMYRPPCRRGCSTSSWPQTP